MRQLILLLTIIVAVVVCEKKRGMATYYYDYTDDNLSQFPSIPLVDRKPSLAYIETQKLFKPQSHQLFRNSPWLNQFIVRFEFYLKINTSGKYQFQTDSNDGTLLFINNQRIIDNDGNHDMPHPVMSSSFIPLTVGYHKTSIYYYNSIHRSGMNIMWRRSTDDPFVTIPASYYHYEHLELEPVIHSIELKKNNKKRYLEVNGFGFLRGKSTVYIGGEPAKEVIHSSEHKLIAHLPTTSTVSDIEVYVNTTTTTTSNVVKLSSEKSGNPNPKLPIEQALYRINCGSKTKYTDKMGKKWSADQYYLVANNNGNTDEFELPFKYPYAGDYNDGRDIEQKEIWGTYDSTIYLTERWDPNQLVYEFPIPPKQHKWFIRLHWAENYEGNFELFDLNFPKKGLKGIGTRVFSVKVNNQVIYDKIDIFQSVGPYSSMVREFIVELKESTKIIRIEFNKIVESPMINGIEIVEYDKVVEAQQLPQPNYQQGLIIDYYDFSDSTEKPLLHMPDFSSRNYTKREIGDYLNNVMSVGNFRTSEYSVQFGAIIHGYLRIPIAGTYRITLESNDGSVLKLNGVELNNDGNHRNIQRFLDFTFEKAGFYPLEIKYFQGLILTCLRLYWVTPEQQQENYEYIPYESTGDIIPPYYFSYNNK